MEIIAFVILVDVVVLWTVNEADDIDILLDGT